MPTSRFGSVAWQKDFEDKVISKVLKGGELDVAEKCFLQTQAFVNLPAGHRMLESGDYYMGYMTPILKPSQNGKVRLERKEVPKDHVEKMYDRKFGTMAMARFDKPAIITRLMEEGLWMSDTPLEAESLASAVELAHGDVLVAGLGLGFLPFVLEASPTVTSIDIVELRPEIIDLVYPQLELKDKTDIICGDFYSFVDMTSKRYDFIYVDIWGSITAPLREINKATASAKKILRPGGEVLCWFQELYDRVKERLPKEPTTHSEFSRYEPCLICGKILRHNYAGLCMDCADSLGVSEMFLGRGG